MERIGIHLANAPTPGVLPRCGCGREMQKLNPIEQELARTKYASAGIHIRWGADIWNCALCCRWFVDSDDLERKADA